MIIQVIEFDTGESVYLDKKTGFGLSLDDLEQAVVLLKEYRDKENK